MIIDDDFYMDLAINEAWKYQLLTYPNPAVGCVVVKNGEILAIEAHQKAGMPHAEVNALKAAFLKKNDSIDLALLEDSDKIHTYLTKHHNNFFEDCEIYVTLEPCNHYGKTPPCSLLLCSINPKRVIISVEDINNNASGGIQKLIQSNIKVTTGVLNSKGLNLLYPFYLSLNGGIKLFKMAQRLNGSIDGGYISSKNMLTFVHKIRENIDLLFIGGNTVRTDRPTLDCRFSSTKTPNIYIYSTQNEFDTTIPLFQFDSRDIKIDNKLDVLCENKFILIEGGKNLFKIVYNHTNLILIILSLSYSNFVNNIDCDFGLEHLHTACVDNELMIWFKKKD